MKEFNSTPGKTASTPQLTHKPMAKNYVRAKKYAGEKQNQINSDVESTYRLIIEEVKKLYSTLPNPNDRIIVELDLTKQEVNPTGIFSFLTPHFYLYIECDVMDRYKVEYELFNCPFEAEIMKLLKTGIVRSYSTEIMKQPDYPAFFEEVIRVQPQRFIRVL